MFMYFVHGCILLLGVIVCDVDGFYHIFEIGIQPALLHQCQSCINTREVELTIPFTPRVVFQSVLLSVFRQCIHQGQHLAMNSSFNQNAIRKAVPEGLVPYLINFISCQLDVCHWWCLH